MQFILSPCGTSLLTNQAPDNDVRKLIFQYANEPNPDNIPDDHKSQLEDLLRLSASNLQAADLRTAARMSAEINGIINLYDGQIPDTADCHFLLATDTWLGEQTAKLVEQWLRARNPNFSVMVHRHDDLQTRDLTLFQSALSDLVKLLSEQIPQYQSAGYHIVFNLTGGFKSVQGFLQSIANFYADETIYIFESSSELLRIPRLPVRMDALDVIEQNLDTFRKLANGLPTVITGSLPETLTMTLEGETALSPWGELIWENSRDELYGRCLWPSPDPEKIRYTERFERSVRGFQPDKFRLINQRIDQLLCYLHDNRKNPNTLYFKELKNPREGSTHQINAWSHEDAKRIFGHFEEATFVLDRLDEKLPSKY